MKQAAFRDEDEEEDTVGPAVGASTDEGRSVMDIMTQRERVLCVSLTDAEWQAFVERHPEPVGWLRRQILEQIPRELHAAVSQASDAPTRRPNPHRV